MVSDIKLMGFEPSVRAVMGRNSAGREYELLTAGPRSYLAQASIEMVEEPVNHILLGSYAALAHEIQFNINTQHDYTRPSIFPWNNPYSKVFDCQLGGNERRQIIIGHDVWIGRGAVLQGGVRIGNGAVVAANAVVTKDVEPYTIVGGSPAKAIRRRFSLATTARMERICWWNWPEAKIIAEKEWMLKSADDFAEHFDPADEAVDFLDVPPQVEQCIRGGDNNYLYVLDPTAKLPLWPKVLAEYCHSYTAKDPVTLFLLGPFGQLPKLRSGVQAFIDTYIDRERAPRIVWVEEPPRVPGELLAAMDIFITSRAYGMLAYLDEADRRGISFVSGTDTWVFGPRSYRHKPFPVLSKKERQ